MVEILSDCLRAIWIIVGCLCGLSVIWTFVAALIDQIRRK